MIHNALIRLLALFLAVPCATMAIDLALIVLPLHNLHLSQVTLLPASSLAGHNTSLPLIMSDKLLMTLNVRSPLAHALRASVAESALVISVDGEQLDSP